MEPVVQSFADRATAYARAVVAGSIPACKWHRLACARHLKDLDRVGSAGFPYVFNPELTDADDIVFRPAERICKFAQLMPHIKGDWAGRGELIVLDLAASKAGVEGAASIVISPKQNTEAPCSGAVRKP